MSTKRLSRRSFFRPLRAEQLEPRTVMDASGWHNDLLVGDVNVDGVVDATDAATIESFLTLYQSTQVAVTPDTCMSNRIFPDANGDWLVNDDDIDFVGSLYGNTEQTEFEEVGGEGGSSLLSGSGSGSSSGSGGGSSSGSGSGSGPGSGSWVLAGTHSGSNPSGIRAARPTSSSISASRITTHLRLTVSSGEFLRRIWPPRVAPETSSGTPN